MMGKKLWGIPVIGIVAIVVVIALAGTAAIAAFMFSRSQPATVVIKGGGADLFADAACTVPLGDTVELDFGEVRQESASETVVMYLKNTGTDLLYPVLSADVNSNLALIEATWGEIGSSPVMLYTPYSSTFVPSGVTNQNSDALTATDTYIHLDGVWTPGEASEPGVLRIGTELIYYEAFDGTPPNYGLVNCVRGYNGSTAQAHSAMSTIEFGTLDTTPVDALDVGEVQTITLYLQADGDLTAYLGDTEAFTVVLEVTSDY